MIQPHGVEQKLAQLWPPDQWQSVGVLLAVSGGADSVALLRAMRAICGGDPRGLATAHFNHRLRGSAADGDERFVVELCCSLEIPCYVGWADVTRETSPEETPAQRPAGGESLEAAARRARYDFLQRTAEERGLRYVVTAHTADDQAETILHHLLRGTGLAGLSGMRRARPLGPAATLLRPLLPLRRRELAAYLGELGQPYRQDEMNADRRFTRSRLRHELLPALRENYNPEIDAALVRLGSLAGEAHEILRGLVDRLREQAVRSDGGGRVVIDCRRLAAAEPNAVEPYLVRELLVAVWTEQNWPLQAMGYAEWERLRAILQDPPAGGATQSLLPGGIVARRDDSTLTLAPPHDRPCLP